MSSDPPPSFALISCDVFSRELEPLLAGAAHIVEKAVLPIGLHDHPDKMRAELQKVIDGWDGRADFSTILLAYGLCGNGSAGLTSRRHRLVIPRAHDCRAVLLGDPALFARRAESCPGCFYYSAGWNRARRVPGPERDAMLRAEFGQRFDPEDVEYLMACEAETWRAYDTAAYLDHGTPDCEAEAKYTEQCARGLGWRFERIKGDISWLRDLVRGNWDPGRFQTAGPGETLAHATDGTILRALPATEIVLRGGDGPERVIHAAQGELADPLADILARHGVALNTRCGGRGWCRGCVLELLDGSLRGADGLPAAPGPIRSCQARLISGEKVVFGMSGGALLEQAPQLGESFALNAGWRLDPPFAASKERDVVLAVDIGTTTVVLLALSLADGSALSRAGAFNAQIRFGDNVLTRIAAAASPAVLEAMRRALVDETLAPLVAELCRRGGFEASRIAGTTVAGNTTMLHILAGEDPTPLGFAPFTPRFLDGRTLTAGEIGLRLENLAAETPLRLLPGLSAYVGADVNAGIQATGMGRGETPELLVDMGTNGELALWAAGRLWVCATAAGPAFEGAGLHSGMRARAGAVEAIRFSLDPFFLAADCIGGAPPRPGSGVCGSAYVDFLARARAAGLLRENGRFDPAVWAALPAAHRVETGGCKALALCPQAGADGPLVSEADVAQLLQAKAAIGAGIETLLDVAGITPREIGTLWLAGGFGMYVNVARAVAIGLLPGFRPEQVRAPGNSSLGGAALAALDRSAEPAMQGWRGRTATVELNLHREFEDRYIDHLRL